MRTSPLLKLFKRNKSDDDVQPTSTSPYGQVSSLWYIVVLLVSLGVGIFACEYYPVQLHWYGVILAYVVSAVFFIPVRVFLCNSFAYSCSNIYVSSHGYMLPPTSRFKLTSFAVYLLDIFGKAKCLPTSGSSTLVILQVSRDSHSPKTSNWGCTAT